MRYASALLFFFPLVLSSAPPAAEAQEPYAPQAVTAEDYARAERFLSGATRSLVFGTSVSPNWMEGGRFWYRSTGPEGSRFLMVDPSRGTREPAFDHEALARALSAATGESYEPLDLPFTTFHPLADGHSIAFDVGETTYSCNLEAVRCSASGRAERPQGGGFGRRSPNVDSPDGTRTAFIRDHNLWMRDLGSGEETQLTTDGVEDFGYGTNNAGWTKSDRPVLTETDASSPDRPPSPTTMAPLRGDVDLTLR